MTKTGIIVDLEHIKAIAQIPLPSNKKCMQSFLGNINFFHKFILDFTQIVKSLQNMIKKEARFKWKHDDKEAFHYIKKSITEAPSLYNLDFNKDFLLILLQM